MDTNSVKPVIGKSIAEVSKETISYINARRKHEIISLKTRWNKFNDVCFIEPNMIYTIAGTSGTGKSAFVNTITNDLIDLNPTQEIVILNLSFEMLSYRNVGRLLSNKLRMTTNELYSANKDISEEEFQQIEQTAKALSNKEIYYVDTPLNVEKIEETIKYYKEHIPFEVIDEKLQTVITYRLKYPESSLQELAEIISLETNSKITKSGLNHRFRKIKKEVEKLKEIKK